MNIIPEWAPSIHPMLVHFPIALLITAAVLDITGLVIGKNERLRFSAVMVYALGALGALASFFTGQDAGDSVLLSAEANPLLTDHADWALRLVWFFGIYALIRIADLWRNRLSKAAIWWPLALLGFGGLFLVYETAEHGAQLVYEQGVGVLAASEQQSAIAPIVLSTEKALIVEPGNAWFWKPTSPTRWDEELSWIKGGKKALAGSLIGSEEHGDVFALQAKGDTVFFVIDEPFQNVQIDLGINLDELRGELSVVHNFRDSKNYLFMKLKGGMMQQGSVQNGTTTVLDEKVYSPDGWQQLRVVADRTHFRAYGGQRVITHGHGKAAMPGAIGLRLEGIGTLHIDRVQATSLARSDGIEHEEH